MRQRSKRRAEIRDPGDMVEGLRRWEERLREQLRPDGVMLILRGNMPASVRVAERWIERTGARWTSPDAIW